MGFNIIHWTPEEDALLFERMRNGERLATIARSFPNRTEKSVLSRASKLRGPDTRDFEQRRARSASDKLCRATMRLMAKMDSAVLQELLWPPMRAVEPGQERIHKTASMERLAA